MNRDVLSDPASLEVFARLYADVSATRLYASACRIEVERLFCVMPVKAAETLVARQFHNDPLEVLLAALGGGDDSDEYLQETLDQAHESVAAARKSGRIH